jgi:hypothetical protein
VKDPKVRKAVQSIRRRMMEEAVGQMTRHATWAVNGIVGIAKEADSYSVRLRAYRALFSDNMAVSKYNGLEDRMTDIENQLEQQNGGASNTTPIWTPPSYGPKATPAAKPPVAPDAAGPG